MITTGIAMKASMEKMNPIRVASCSGLCEKEKIASNEKRIIRGSVYLVWPAYRASRS